MRIHRIGQKRTVRVRRFIVKVSSTLSFFRFKLSRIDSVQPSFPNHGVGIGRRRRSKCEFYFSYCPCFWSLLKRYWRGKCDRTRWRKECNKSRNVSSAWFPGPSPIRRFGRLGLRSSKCFSDELHDKIIYFDERGMLWRVFFARSEDAQFCKFWHCQW